MLLLQLLNVRLWLFSHPYFTLGYIGGRKKLCINKFEQRKSIITLVLLSVFLVLFRFYNRESFIYTTGISVRSVSQLKIVLYRWCIGFVGSAIITLIVYTIRWNENVRHHWISRLLIYIGKNLILIYLVDSLINSYILIHLSQEYGINYIIVAVETVFVLVICYCMERLMRKFSNIRAVLLGSRWGLCYEVPGFGRWYGKVSV